MTAAVFPPVPKVNDPTCGRKEGKPCFQLPPSGSWRLHLGLDFGDYQDNFSPYLAKDGAFSFCIK